MRLRSIGRAAPWTGWQTSMPDKRLPFRKERALSVRGPTAPARSPHRAQSKRSNGPSTRGFFASRENSFRCARRSAAHRGQRRFRMLGTTIMRRTLIAVSLLIAALALLAAAPQNSAKPDAADAARLNNLGVAYMNQQ